MAKRSSSSRWLQRQRRDPFVRQAQKSHYSSRAVYKLIALDEQDQLFHAGQTVIDLGAAPGSWSQYAARKVGAQGRVIAVDQLPLEKIDNVLFIKGNILDSDTVIACRSALGEAEADLVISDMAPNLSGIKVTDQARSMALAEAARDFALQVLKQGGTFLVKVFEGTGTRAFRSGLQEHFQQVMVRKPEASRGSSSEIYLLARSRK